MKRLCEIVKEFLMEGELCMFFGLVNARADDTGACSKLWVLRPQEGVGKLTGLGAFRNMHWKLQL